MAPKLKLLEDVPSDWGTLASWPLLSALAYIFIMPQIAYRLQQYNLMVNRWRSDDKLDYEESRAKKRAKVAEARAKADAAEFDRTAQEEQWHNQIAQLEADKQRLEHQLQDLKHQRDSFENTKHEENPSLQSKVAELEQKSQRLEKRVEQVISDRQRTQELLTAKVERIKELEAILSEVEPKQL